MQGQKISPYIDEHGRQYFNFCLGAQYLCEDMANSDQLKYIVYKIIQCEYRNGTEYYHVTRDGKILPNAITANRLHYILNFTLVDVLEPGERQELPLTIEEVAEYYKQKAMEQEKQKENLRKAVEDDSEYQELAKTKKKLMIKMAFAEVKGDYEEFALLQPHYQSIEDIINRKMRCNNIDVVALDNSKKVCPYCGNTGVYRGQICKCAKQNEEIIKDYFAVKRLRQVKPN